MALQPQPKHTAARSRPRRQNTPKPLLNSLRLQPYELIAGTFLSKGVLAQINPVIGVLPLSSNEYNPEYETRQIVEIDQNVRLTTGLLSWTPRKTLTECQHMVHLSIIPNGSRGEQ